MLILVFIVLCLLSPIYMIYKPPKLLIRYMAYRYPDVLWHVPIKDKIVALTLDDAPSQHTREIMQVLEEYGVKATFFVIGGQVGVDEHGGGEGMEILKDLVRSGHELGNHGMHDEPARSLPLDELERQITEVEGMIRTAYQSVSTRNSDHHMPKYYRPGSGFFSTKMRALLSRMGYHLIGGSIYPHDPQIQYASVNARHILSMLRPGGIVICHDRRSWTVPMLKRVLKEATEKGWKFVTVSQLLAAGAEENRDKAT